MTVDDNSILPFSLEGSNLRGRALRLGPVLDEILSAHKYPDLVTDLTAQVTVLTILLGSMLKFEGVFTLQAQGDGPIRLLVSDVTTAGVVRACATFKDERLKEIPSQASLADILGKGYMAFTVDQGPETDRYQGIVELKGDSLVESVQHNFIQSEQLSTGIRMAVGLRDGKWRGGAVMVQRLPKTGQDYHAAESTLTEDEDWHRIMMLLNTCSDDELLDKNIASRDLLFRLFHEEGVRIYDIGHVSRGCRCGRDRLLTILSAMPQDDIEHMTENGKITMVCQFCNNVFDFKPDEIERNIAQK